MTRPPPRLRRISTLIGLSAGAMIVLASASLVHVGLTASGEADALAVKSERGLFETVLGSRFQQMSRDQLSLARWDKSVRNVTQKFNRKHVKDEIFDSLWYDYALPTNVIVGGDGVVLAAARRDEVEFPDEPRRLDGDLALLRQRAVDRYMRNRVETDHGFLQRHVSTAHIDEIAETGFVEIDGAPAMASAMAVVPDEDSKLTLPDGPPVILISARPIDGELTADFTRALGVADLSFGATAVTTATQRPVTAVDGRAVGWFSWRGDTPGDRIWRVIVPLIVASAAVLALAGALVARGIGRLSERLEASEAFNRHLARHDALSGLANRFEVDQRLRAAVAGLPDRPFAWIACELDRFKAVNDTFGHAAGDTVIRTVAARLGEAVGSSGLVGRIGGDEFVVLITAFHDRPRLMVLARAIIDAIRTPITLDGGGITDVGVSLGIALVTDTDATVDTVATAADAALYEAKARGRGCAVFAHEVAEPRDDLASEAAAPAPSPTVEAPPETVAHVA